MIELPASLLTRTFDILRQCGGGRKECQVLWLSAPAAPDLIVDVIHPQHSSHRAGFQVDDAWITQFWLQMRRDRRAVRAQVHTHPHEAGHSCTDDNFPFIHTEGFVSVVIPNFAVGRACLDGVYVTEITEGGRWRRATPATMIRLK